MGREAFRFIHAAGLFLDEPLTGLGPLSGDHRRLAEDATLIAWNRIGEACFREGADFLLLSGNIFNANTVSLRARVALSRCFESLADRNVAVYIVPGETDPAPEWRQFVELPPNVVLLSGDETSPAQILRGENLLATLFVVAPPHGKQAHWGASESAASDQASSPFQIGVLPAGVPVEWCDGRPMPSKDQYSARAIAARVQAVMDGGVQYLALGTGRQTIPLKAGVAHAPGPAQALNAGTSGYCGCSVVEVPASGPIHIEPVATAPIRFDTIRIEFSGEVDWDTLIERMADAALNRDVGPEVNLWLIDWDLQGTGAIFNEITRPSMQQDLWELLDAELDDLKAGPRRHRLMPLSGPIILESEDALMHELVQIIDEEGDRLAEQLLPQTQFLQRRAGRYAPQLVDVLHALSRSSLVSRARYAALAHLNSADQAPNEPPKMLAREWDVA